MALTPHSRGQWEQRHRRLVQAPGDTADERAPVSESLGTDSARTQASNLSSFLTLGMWPLSS